MKNTCHNLDVMPINSVPLANALVIQYNTTLALNPASWSLSYHRIDPDTRQHFSFPEIYL